jgi:TPR repeat protein
MLFLDSVSKMQAQLDGSSQRRAILRPRLLWVLALLTVLAGCSDAQQSGLVTKLKTLLGSETANSTAAAEPDPLRTRENKLNELRKKAEAGDVSAMVELGHAYEDGRSWRSGSGGKFGGIAIEETFVEFDKAAEWYRKAAEQGHAEAQVRLGLLYKKGTGVQKDLAKALEWFEKAAAQGYIDAQYRVGEI